ncbi:hypothetical protein LCGC14_2813130 [marine sediment metagenome]|uniref:Uncharacterized protein n=1 Tax=marine sediment metagenome TaxID=412755 RepID=A0A0F8Z649_9ZZZZ
MTNKEPFKLSEIPKSDLPEGWKSGGIKVAKGHPQLRYAEYKKKDKDGERFVQVIHEYPRQRKEHFRITQGFDFSKKIRVKFTAIGHKENISEANEEALTFMKEIDAGRVSISQWR